MSWTWTVLACWVALNAGFVAGCWWRSRSRETLADRVAPYCTAGTTWTWTTGPTAPGGYRLTPNQPNQPPLKAVD